MTKNSFFVTYEFKQRTSGLFGDFKAEKLYSVEYGNQRDNCMEEVEKIFKAKQDCTVTFSCFTGYEFIDLLRIFKEASGKYTQVYWNRTKSGFVAETVVKKDLEIHKANLNHSFHTAISKFLDYELEDNEN